MMKKKYGVAIVLFLTMISIGVAAGQSAQHHNHQHDKRLDGIHERGDHAMGFSHEKATHHFRLTADGGAIEVTANDPKDSASVEQIRMHLSHIAKLFKNGDFSKAMLTHGEAPSGVDVMQRLKEEITYTFENIANGGRVLIETQEPQALAAIHEFLRYQIKDHKTGDPLDVTSQQRK